MSTTEKCQQQWKVYDRPTYLQQTDSPPGLLPHLEGVQQGHVVTGPTAGHVLVHPAQPAAIGRGDERLGEGGAGSDGADSIPHTVDNKCQISALTGTAAPPATVDKHPVTVPIHVPPLPTCPHYPRLSTIHMSPLPTRFHYQRLSTIHISPLPICPHYPHISNTHVSPLPTHFHYPHVPTTHMQSNIQ